MLLDTAKKFMKLSPSSFMDKNSVAWGRTISETRRSPPIKLGETTEFAPPLKSFLPVLITFAVRATILMRELS